MSQGQQQPQVVDLNQLKAMRQQQAVGKLQNIMNIALQMFLQGKAQDIPDAFILAEQFVYHFENVVIKKEEERLKNKPTL